MPIRRALGACFFLFAPLLAPGQQMPVALSPPQPQLPTQAQIQPASIIGTVTDAANDAIPSAAVVLDGPTSTDHSTTTSDVNGFFAFRNLRPAVSYRLTIDAKGFVQSTTSAIVLQPGQGLDLADITLKIGVVQTTTVTALTTEQLATQEVQVEEQQRVLGVFPNFYVTYDPHPVPLTTKLKYQLALRTTIDPVNVLATAAFAAINQAGDTPNYQQGAVGYAQRFGAGFTDGFTDIMIGGAILPSLLHQDPRYFYKGTGTVKSRIGYAIAFAVICKGDNGRWQVNYSSIGGDLASGAISNIYYPPSNRGPGLVFDNALISAGGRAIGDIAQEFLFRRFTPTAKRQN
jgi:hypothetical protein